MKSRIIINTVLTGLLALTIYATKVKADNICVAGNFDGNTKKAEYVLEKAKKNKADAILLMGDYSVRGIQGNINYKTDFKSTEEVLSVFSNFDGPVYILSGSNDNPQDIKEILKEHDNLTPLSDNTKTSIADLSVLPLNGYNYRNFMFEGAKYVSDSEFKEYLSNLSKSDKGTVSVTHISPYGHIDKALIAKNLSSKKKKTLLATLDKVSDPKQKQKFVMENFFEIKSVGEISLEKVLASKNIDSISSAIRESPGAYNIDGRWKINPGDYTFFIITDGKGTIEKIFR